MGLILAGAMAGGGAALQQSGLQMQRDWSAESLEKMREDAATARQNALIEAQKFMQGAGFAHAEKILERGSELRKGETAAEIAARRADVEGASEKERTRIGGIIGGVSTDQPAEQLPVDIAGPAQPARKKTDVEYNTDVAKTLTKSGDVAAAKVFHDMATKSEALDVKLATSRLTTELQGQRNEIALKLGEMRLALLQAQTEARATREAAKPSRMVLMDLQEQLRAANKDYQSAQYGKPPEDFIGDPVKISQWRQSTARDSVQRLSRVQLKIGDYLERTGALPDGQTKYQYADIPAPEDAAKEFLKKNPTPKTEQIAAFTAQAMAIYGPDAAGAIGVVEQTMKSPGASNDRQWIPLADVPPGGLIQRKRAEIKARTEREAEATAAANEEAERKRREYSSGM